MGAPVIKSHMKGRPVSEGDNKYLLSGDTAKSHNCVSNCAPENFWANLNLLVES